MAQRIHVTWGLLPAIIGFAVLGALSGYLLLEDFHGHLYRQCLVFAASSGVLGVCGWLLSERVSNAANLNTSALLRLTLSGVGACVIATWVCAPFAELTVGAGRWWPEIAGGALFLAAAMLPLAAGLTVMCGLEILLVAQRGGTGLISAFRPIAPFFLAGALLLTVAVGSGIYLPTEIHELMLKLAPDRPRVSGWIQREKGLFARVLAGLSCDVLVTQVDAPAAAGGLDRPARSLITRYLAHGISAQTGLCVVDPTLAFRALGATTRRVDAREALALATAANARWLVRGEVTLAEDQRSFELTVRTFARGEGPNPVWTAGEAATLDPIEFSDQLPPEAAFQPHVAALVERLGLGGDKRAEPPEVQPARAELPDTLDQLVDDAGSDLGRAEHLQLLAMLYAPDDDAAEHLWERSLVALERSSVDSEATRVLRARAALQLHRRPYAVALLQGLASAEAHALLAIAQSNLSEAEQWAGRIQGRSTALMTQLEVEALRDAFGRPAGQRERRQSLAAAYPGYAVLLGGAQFDPEPGQGEAQATLARQLSRLGASVADDPQDVARRWSRVAMLETAVAGEVAKRSAAIERSYAPLWLGRGGQWRTRPAADRLAEWDLYDALYEANRAALVSEVAGLRAPGGQPDAALSLARGLTPLFGGYPPLEAIVALSLDDLRARRSGSPDALQTQREQRLVRDLQDWTGGDDQVSHAIAALAAPPVYARDDPPRGWRLMQLSGAAGRASVRQAAPLTQAAATQLMRAIQYSEYDFAMVEQAYAALRRAGSNADADRLVAYSQEHFLGHPERDRFLTELAEERGDTAALIALLQQRQRERPQDWDTCLRLAKAQLIAGQMDAAQRTLLAYPQFSASGSVSPEAAERAWHAGELLLRAGEPALAQPVFAVGARDSSGSPGAMWSALRLNQLAGNWRQARDWAHALHDKHAAAGALSAAAQISFLLGESDAGWRGFYEAAKRFEDIGPWEAALLGHRRAQTADKEVLDFVTRWKSLSGDPRSEAKIKDAFVFQALMIDRSSEKKVLDSLSAFAGRAGDDLHQQLGPAYEAFRRGDFPAAADRFGTLVAAAGKADVSYALPYLAASLVKAGRAREAQALLRDARARGRIGFSALLATAYVNGLNGDANAAFDALWRAQLELPEAPPATVPPSFQLLEACEKLLELTGDERYRQWLLNLARRSQLAWPASWAYAFEAKYATDPHTREQALALAVYLDAGSAHLAGFGDAQRKRAVGAFERNNPFTGRSEKQAKQE